MGRKRWRKDNWNLSVGKNVRNAHPETARSGSRTGQTELKKTAPVFPIDISDLPIPLSGKSIQNLYNPHHCGFMEKSQEYGMT